MPNQPIIFPANFATASAVAFTNPDGTAQLVSADTALPVSGALTDTQLRATPISVGIVDGALTTLGAQADAPANSDTGAFSLMALTKRLVGKVSDSVVTSGSVTAVGAVVSVPTVGFSGGSFHVTSAGTTCTVTYEQSNDNVNWVALPVISLAVVTAAPTLTTTAAGIYGFVSSAAFVRARVSTYTSGTVAISLTQKRVAQHVSGTSLAGGTASIGSVTVTGTVNSSTGYTDSVAALAASANFTGTGRGIPGGQFAFFAASAYADQAGTLFIDQSLDIGATFFPVTSVAVGANTTGQLAVRITGAISSATVYRVRYVNGATAQANFRLASCYTAS